MITQNEIEKLVELKELAEDYARLQKEIKARVEAGEETAPGGWQLNPQIIEKQIVAWKKICVRELGQSYCDNVQHNTKRTRMLILKPAFSISAEKTAKNQFRLKKRLRNQPETFQISEACEESPISSKWRNKMKTYRVWVCVEEVDESTDSYEDVTIPEVLIAFDTEEDASNFTHSLAKIFQSLEPSNSYTGEIRNRNGGTRK
jgi:hypothetical protein